MKFGDYVKFINEMVRKNPEVMEYNVVYSIDDEGNEFKEVYFTPTIGRITQDGFDSDSGPFDSVCVN